MSWLVDLMRKPIAEGVYGWHLALLGLIAFVVGFGVRVWRGSRRRGGDVQ